MPTRINPWTVKYYKGETIPEEFGWYTGRKSGEFSPERDGDLLLRRGTDNFITRAYPWNVDGNRVATCDVLLGAPPEIIDKYAIVFNEYGEVAP